MATRHARLGPSSFGPREVCPSYTSDAEDTAASKRGHILHALLEQHGSAAIHDPAVKDLPERDKYQLQLICDYIEPIEGRTGGWEYFREFEFDLRPLGIPHCELGTGDFIAVHEKAKVAELIDYKFGWWEVEDAEFNIQLWLYVLGVFITWNVESVFAQILQPGRDMVSSHVFQRSDMARMLLRAKTIAERVLDQDLKIFNPVHENCLFCDFKSKCEALQALALQTASQAKLSVPISRLDLKTIAESRDGKLMGQAYDLADLLERWAKDTRRLISDSVKAHSYDVPGHQLVLKNGRKSIIDVPLAKKILAEKWGFTPEDFLSTVDISLSSLQELIRKKATPGQKDKLVAQVMQSLIDEGIVIASPEVAYLKRV